MSRKQIYMKSNFDKKKILYLLLGYTLCISVTYFLDEIIFARIGYDIIGASGKYVISDPMKYHISALLLLILWELKRLNSLLRNNTNSKKED